MILIVIMTYSREEMLRQLLCDIRYEGVGMDYLLRVYDDATPGGLDLTDLYHVPVIRNMHHSGKRWFWQWMNRVLKDARRNKGWTRLLVLPDDVRLAPGFFERLEAAWKAIPTSSKLLLNPLMDARGPSSHWTKINPVFVDKGPGLYQVGWNDGCFYCERRMVERFTKFRMPNARRWRKAYISTSVGEQISKFAVRSGFTLWQVADSLLWHGDHSSQMHAQP